MVSTPQIPDERTPKAVGYRLKVLRAALDNMPAKEMCGAINVAQNTWSQWEKGRNLPDVLSMSRLWEKFGANLDYIFLGRTDTLPFDLAMRIRAILARGSVREHGEVDEVNLKRNARRTNKEPSPKSKSAAE